MNEYLEAIFNGIDFDRLRTVNSLKDELLKSYIVPSNDKVLERDNRIRKYAKRYNKLTLVFDARISLNEVREFQKELLYHAGVGLGLTETFIRNNNNKKEAVDYLRLNPRDSKYSEKLGLFVTLEIDELLLSTYNYINDLHFEHMFQKLANSTGMSYCILERVNLDRLLPVKVRIIDDKMVLSNLIKDYLGGNVSIDLTTDELKITLG